MTNMANWITDEVGKENLGVDLPHYLSKRSDAELVYVAEVLKGYKTQIAREDLDSLIRQEDIPREIREVITKLVKLPDLHPKFWRYMNLYVEVISNT